MAPGNPSTERQKIPSSISWEVWLGSGEGRLESGQDKGVLGYSEKLREALQSCVGPSLGASFSRGAGLSGWDGGRERVCRDGRGVWLAAGFEQMIPMQRNPQSCLLG